MPVVPRSRPHLMWLREEVSRALPSAILTRSPFPLQVGPEVRSTTGAPCIFEGMASPAQQVVTVAMVTGVGCREEEPTSGIGPFTVILLPCKGEEREFLPHSRGPPSAPSPQPEPRSRAPRGLGEPSGGPGAWSPGVSSSQEQLPSRQARQRCQGVPLQVVFNPTCMLPLPC